MDEKENYDPRGIWWPTALVAIIGLAWIVTVAVVTWRRSGNWFNTVIAVFVTICVTFAMARWERRSFKQSRHFHRRCPACGYDVRFSRGRCPECGRDLRPVHPGFMSRK